MEHEVFAVFGNSGHELGASVDGNDVTNARALFGGIPIITVIRESLHMKKLEVAFEVGIAVKEESGDGFWYCLLYTSDAADE